MAEVLAQLFYVSPRYVHQLAQTQVIPAQLGPGKYDLVGSVQRYIAFLEKRKADALTDERALLLAAKEAPRELRPS